VSVKDRAVLAPMASLELCTDRMSGFMGPDKLSSFCNYYVKPHLPASCGAFTFRGRMRPRAKTLSREQGPDFASCGAFTFRGRMRPRAKTSSREQEPDFDIVGTCKWLSYVRASGSQAYDVLVRFFPCMVYIDLSHQDTLGYE
jgi:hypothetical protein